VLDTGNTGKGSTIVIIDAFQSPTIQHDLNLFDKTFGLHTPTLHIIAPDGLTPFNPKDSNQVNWSFEISLDVEWSHAIAPDATIDLVLARSNMDTDLLSVTKYAVDHNLGDVISQSFSEAEQCVDPALAAQEHTVYQKAASMGITIFASSGDWGAAQFTCNGSSFIKSVGWPASDPLVTGVGGTHLNANLQTGRYQSETAWNDSFGASGGGFSMIYTRPSYQSIVHNTQRGVPDLAFDADVNGGVLTVWSEGPGGANAFYIAGGTSVGSPSMAGEIALVNQAFGHRLGNINVALYLSLGVPSEYFTSFNDIETGTNTFTGAGSNGKTVTVVGYKANKGWDAVTGLGTLILGNTFFGIPGEGFRDR
jgi:subtilase family serine protease